MGKYHASLVVQMVKNLPAMWIPSPGSGRSPGGGNGSPVFLPREFHGQRSLGVYHPWGCKESETTEQLSSYTTLPGWEAMHLRGNSDTTVVRTGSCPHVAHLPVGSEDLPNLRQRLRYLPITDCYRPLIKKWFCK